MRLNLGWDQATCAKNFHVTERTLHNWESGRTDVPYTAYRLLRLLNRMELPGPSWDGWCFVGGVLYTPGSDSPFHVGSLQDNGAVFLCGQWLGTCCLRALNASK